MRCDLHVHSKCSGLVSPPVLRRFSRECYSEPRAVYEQARLRGMDLVTLTDHDTIEGTLEILSLPGTFASVELTCELGGGRELHLGVWGLHERQHARLQALRSDAEALFAYLAEERLPACVNHPFAALTGPRDADDLHFALQRVRLVEARNSMLPAHTNTYARRAAEEGGLATVGGSDAHALGSVARAWTEIEGARSVADFLEGLRRGWSLPRGSSGSYARLTRDVLAVCAGAYVENAQLALRSRERALALCVLVAALPIVALAPLVTAVIYGQECAFAHRVWRAFHASRRPSRGGPVMPGLVLEPGR